MDNQPAKEPPAFVRRDRGALDWLNFFIADVQTGFGPFVAVYLTQQKWTQAEIGVALTIGTITALVAQVPAGALVDAVRAKRTAAAIGVLAVTFSALLLALAPGKIPVALAEILHGIASCVIGPAVAALSLRIAGYAGMGERLGRNARFAAIGNGLAAAVLGFVGTHLGSQSVFFVTAALGAPALFALSRIHPLPVVGRARVARPFDRAGVLALLADRRLIAFAACALLFHLSNAAMLPLAAGEVTSEMGATANQIIAACVVAQQIVVAALSPRVGRLAQSRGRRLVLLIGWMTLPVRGLIMALLPGAAPLLVAQAIGGIGGAVFGVMLPLIAADVTARSGRLTLAMGLAGLPIYVGAALSTTLAGFVATDFGDPVAFLALGAVGAGGTAVVWLAMPETLQDAAVPVVRVPARG